MRISGTLAPAGTTKTLECHSASINLASTPQRIGLRQDRRLVLARTRSAAERPVRRHSLTRPVPLRPVCGAASAVANAARSDAPSRRSLLISRRRFPLLSKEWRLYYSVGLGPSYQRKGRPMSFSDYSFGSPMLKKKLLARGSTESSSKSAPSAAIPRSRRAIRARMEQLRRRSGFQSTMASRFGTRRKASASSAAGASRGGHRRGRRRRRQETEGFRYHVVKPQLVNYCTTTSHASEP
jgi:hypothetical protein